MDILQEPNQQPAVRQVARKLEAAGFRHAGVSKGRDTATAENGKVVLRGEVDSPEMIEDLVSKARKVQGVQDVESLLTAS